MNLPNKITLIRIFLIPVVIFFFMADFIPYGKLVAFIIYVLAACTDFVDGMIARRTNQVTDLGKLLDPIADKCLVMATLILLISWPINGGLPIMGSTPNYVGIIGIIGVIIILAREFIISALRQIAAAKNFVMKADKAGKLKTVFQDITIGGYILYAFLVSEFTLGITINAVIAISLFVLFCISVLLTVYSGVNYLVKNKNVLREKKKMTKVEGPLEKPIQKLEMEEDKK